MRKALKLFVLRDSSGAIIGGEYFADKSSAKAVRATLAGVVTVSPGPDHHRWKGDTK